MIKPFVSDELFEINYNADISFDSENQIIYIDNIFKNYDEILNYIYNINVESWKKSPISRNFIDYYDCRHVYMNLHSYSKDTDYFYNIMSEFYHLDKKKLYFEKGYSFNYFKNNLKGLNSNLQHFPHCDNEYNIIFYLDTVCSGGTALYSNKNNLKGFEDDNLFYDISKLNIKHIIKAKPNRAVIFKGDTLHGGYIDDHDVYYYNWRINMVNFVREDL